MKICKICNKKFFVRKSRIKKAKFCSFKCYWEHLKGKSPKSAWTKGHVPWNKGINMPEASGDNHFAWKGGIKISRGYIYILKKDHPFCNKQGYIREHRLVIEKHIGRYLKRTEVVHHINGIKHDNRIENLKLLKNQSEHIEIHRPFMKT